MTASASLQIRSDLAELTRLAGWIESWTRQHEVPDLTAQTIDLCAAEAVTNVMTHGLADADGAAIDVRLGRDGEDVVLQIEDGGSAFDPTTAPPPPPVTLESDKVGGWGIGIVTKLSDKVRYDRVNGRNRLTLVFHPRSSAVA